jgi:protein-tyrosine-phosphatase
LVLCTGNAARSVMAGFMLEHLAATHGAKDLHLLTAGTHTIDGQPMGRRTRTALLGVPDLAGVELRHHRSRQVLGPDLAGAELVVVMEADHVRFVRRRYPEAADRTATIRRLCADLAPAPPDLAARLSALKLADAPLFDADDVSDPAGGDEATYVACVDELWPLCQQLIDLL